MKFRGGDLPVSRWSLAIVGLGVVTAIASSAQPLLIARVIDSILAGGAVVYLIAGFGMTVALILVGETFSKLAHASYLRSLRDQWRSLLLREAVDDESRIEGLASQSNNDVEAVIQSVYFGRIQLILSLVSLGTAGIGLTMISPIFLVLVALCAALMVVIPAMFRSRIGRRKAEALRKTKLWNSSLIQTVQALTLFRRRRALASRVRHVGALSRRATEAHRSAEACEGIVDVAVGGVLFVNQLLIIVVGWILIDHGLISVGALVAALQFEDLVLTPMLAVADSMTTIAGGRMMVRELEEGEDGEGGDAKLASGGLCVDVSQSSGGSSFLADATDGTLIAVPPTSIRVGVDGPRIEIPEISVCSGERVLLSGPSGVGKSTIARFIAGEFAIAGDNSRRCRIGYLPAEEPCFDQDATYDISLGREVSSERLSRVVAHVDSTDGNIGLMMARGNTQNASLGERQRISLARVLIDPPEVLILDEALGHLDSSSSRSLLDTLQFSCGISLIVIRHALAGSGESWSQEWEVREDGESRRLVRIA